MARGRVNSTLAPDSSALASSISAMNPPFLARAICASPRTWIGWARAWSLSLDDDDAVEARAALETRRARDAAAAARQGRETMDADMKSRVEARRRRRGAPGVGVWPRGKIIGPPDNLVG